MAAWTVKPTSTGSRPSAKSWRYRRRHFPETPPHKRKNPHPAARSAARRHVRRPPTRSQWRADPAPRGIGFKPRERGSLHKRVILALAGAIFPGGRLRQLILMPFSVKYFTALGCHGIGEFFGDKADAPRRGVSSPLRA